MPPFVSRKIPQSQSLQDRGTPPKPKKPTLFDTIDASTSTTTVDDTRKFLNGLHDSESSSPESSDAEDVLESAKKRRKLNHHDDEDEDIEWEDAVQGDATTPITMGPMPSGDLELTLGRSQRHEVFADSGKKKGPSKIERQIRNATHCMHVQFLLFHNLMRNAWISDTEVQEILVERLSRDMKAEVAIWKRDSRAMDEPAPSIPTPPSTKVNGKEKHGKNAGKIGQRDWSSAAQRLSAGDPTIRLLRELAKYWKQEFTVTAPSLRKEGYKTLVQLEEEIASFRTLKHDPNIHGEKIDHRHGFKDCAKRAEGSRDVGAQLFTALLRGLGIEARLVASLQPIGFGWSKTEDAVKKKQNAASSQALPTDLHEPSRGSDFGKRTTEALAIEAHSTTHTTHTTKRPAKSMTKPDKEPASSAGIPKRRKAQAAEIEATKATTIHLSSDSDLSSADAEVTDSVVEVSSTRKKRPNMKYDRDILFPTYWTEAISPLTHQVIPVETMLFPPDQALATSPDRLIMFEPRGTKAEKAKQVMAYVIAFSPDGTAKEVTTRYLKNHMWPGKTKGWRMPIEKIAVTNKRGKVRRYEEYDWFKSVMSGYLRSLKMRTAVDEIEEAKDLKVNKPEKKVATKEGEETLQGYKQSADFVLERHLRREEAILPAAIPVKYFTVGKGENPTEEAVFRRRDVVACRTSESWHKEGRQIKPGEQPLKMVPVRAVTLTRKREVEEAERDTGEKVKQGLYSEAQTIWIIPPPIKNGLIPKNAYGNMDCFVPTMVPEGAVHLPMKGTVRICKRLEIDFAEAVVGFEFGNKRAVPVILGVVIADRYQDKVIAQWEKDEVERQIKADGKREKIALGMWRKFLMGLRIVERVQGQYGGEQAAEELNPFTKKGKHIKDKEVMDLSMEEHPSHDFDKRIPDYHANDTNPGPISEDTHGGFLVEDESKSQTLSTFDSTPFTEPEFTFAKPGRDQLQVDTEESSDDDDVDEPPRARTIPKPRKAPTKAVRRGQKVQPTSRPQPAERLATSTRSMPKRKAALKSHYFEHSSGSEKSEFSSSISQSETDHLERKG